MEYFELNDGNKIPAIGFGVFMIPADGPTYEAVLAALKAGYRHIDTAAAYMNEQDVGRAVRDSGIPREEIFVTTKLWPQDYAAADAPAGIRRSLDNLGLDYIDLMLLHQPYGPVDEAWAALEEAKEQGLVRSIGVSNMSPAIWNKWVPGFSGPVPGCYPCRILLHLPAVCSLARSRVLRAGESGRGCIACRCGDTAAANPWRHLPSSVLLVESFPHQGHLCIGS